MIRKKMMCWKLYFPKYNFQHIIGKYNFQHIIFLWIIFHDFWHLQYLLAFEVRREKWHQSGSTIFEMWYGKYISFSFLHNPQKSRLELSRILSVLTLSCLTQSVPSLKCPRALKKILFRHSRRYHFTPDLWGQWGRVRADQVGPNLA